MHSVPSFYRLLLNHADCKKKISDMSFPTESLISKNSSGKTSKQVPSRQLTITTNSPSSKDIVDITSCVLTFQKRRVIYNAEEQDEDEEKSGEENEEECNLFLSDDELSISISLPRGTCNRREACTQQRYSFS